MYSKKFIYVVSSDQIGKFLVHMSSVLTGLTEVLAGSELKTPGYDIRLLAKDSPITFNFELKRSSCRVTFSFAEEDRKGENYLKHRMLELVYDWPVVEEFMPVQNISKTQDLNS